MKQQLAVLAFALVGLAACGPAPERVFFEEPSDARLSGVWSGTEEITTDNDITPNENFPGPTAGGFSFPVVVSFDTDGRFTLWVSNYSASFYNEGDRTCSGVYTHANASVQFYPSDQCRALPMSKYVLGRTLPAGITLEARTNTSGDPMANYASVHVRFNLQRE